ncbi:MAG: hypothetical protein ACLQG3_05590 [Terracidiphilus sp.]
MKTLFISIAVVAALCVCLPVPAEGQDFLDGGVSAGSGTGLAAAASASSSSFADGTRAINQGRWDDAIAIFTQLADQKGDYADGALYWKAYAENKLGRSGQALDTCTALLQQYPASSWIEECGALKIQIRAMSGEPVRPSAEQSDELKLLALASLMQRNEKQALAQIDEILNGDSSEKLKQGALFIMREHHTDAIYPQIVRVSFVEGDVRVLRGAVKGRAKDSSWEQAVADLPLETGYSLVTGKGRAEIEFEDDSTLYLGEDSVLLFNDLHTLAGVPHTEVALLAGTVTQHVKPHVRGEWFVLKTPTDMLSTIYPYASNLRVTSYVDGIAVTPLDAGGLRFTGGSEEPLKPGKALYFKEGRPIIEAGPIHPPDFTAWDNWVAARYTQRQQETAEALKASGLDSPIPGLADLAQAGNFFPCEPYGTCWEPNRQQPATTGNALAVPNGDQGKSTELAEISPSVVQTAGPGSKIAFVGKPMANPSVQSSPRLLEIDAFFPCMPDEIRYLILRSWYPTADPTLYPALSYSAEPWSWAVCHAGSWIYRNRGYAWVVGKPHHRPPLRWVKSGRTVAFVPVHPYDIKDRPPVNRRNGVFAVDPKGVHPVERVELEAGSRVELLNEPPRALQPAFVPPLARAEEPHIVAHELKELAVAANSPIKPAGIPIAFDHKSQTFMMSHQVMQGGKSITVLAPVGGNRGGGLQARGSFSGGGSASHGGSYGGGSRGSSSSSGGGSHSSGGSATSTSSSSSSSTGATSTTSSSSAGGHH